MATGIQRDGGTDGATEGQTEGQRIKGTRGEGQERGFQSTSGETKGPGVQGKHTTVVQAVF